MASTITNAERIAGIHQHLTGGKLQRWVSLVDVRAAMASVPRDEQDAALTHLLRGNTVTVATDAGPLVTVEAVLSPDSDRAGLTDAARHAALPQGREALHLLTFQSAE